jgi:hypothetical protein
MPIIALSQCLDSEPPELLSGLATAFVTIGLPEAIDGKRIK